MELTTTSIMSLFDTTKEQRQSFVTDIVTQVNNGEVDVLKIHKEVKSLEEIVKAITSNEDYKKALLTEAKKNGKKLNFANAEFQIKEAGVKYNYLQCNDELYNKFKDEQLELDQKIKDREAFLKAIPSVGLPVLNETTGEVVTIYPPAKSSTTTVQVTLK